MGRAAKLGLLGVGGLVLAALTIPSMAYISGGWGELLESTGRILSVEFAVALLLLLASELVRAARLALIARAAGVRLGYGIALAARLVGRFAGLLTPASIGGGPARAAVIGAYTGAGTGRSLGLVVGEAAYDSLVPVAVALPLALTLLPETTVIIVLSAALVASWLWGLKFAAKPTVEELIARRGGKRLYCYVRRQRLLFIEAIKANASPGVAVAAAALTLASHLVEALALLILAGSVPLTKLILAVEASYISVLAPTPGGSGVFEYTVSRVLDPEGVVVWRAAFIVVSLAPGVLLVTLIPRLKAAVTGWRLEEDDCENL